MLGKHHHATIESEQVFLKLGKQHTYISWLMPKSIQLNAAVRGVLYLFQTSALFLGLHLRLCTPRNEVQLCIFICMIIKEKIADCIWVYCLYSSNIYLTNRIGWIEISQVFNETLKPCVVLVVYPRLLLQLPYCQILLTCPLQARKIVLARKIGTIQMQFMSIEKSTYSWMKVVRTRWKPFHGRLKNNSLDKDKGIGK
jgi:hypothetical protein